MRHVPLDAAADPRAEHPDERGLDDVLAVEEVVAVGLVHGREDAPAELRQDADLDVLILQEQRLVGDVGFHVRQHVLHGIGIERGLRALVGATFVKARHGRRRRRQVCGDDEVRFPAQDRRPGGETGGGHHEAQDKPEQGAGFHGGNETASGSGRQDLIAEPDRPRTIEVENDN